MSDIAQRHPSQSDVFSIEPLPAAENRKTRIAIWGKTLRVHQWSKNVLAFVPLCTAQAFNAHAFGQAFGAFLAFSLCASCIYVFNDLADLDADRAHPTKKNRPLAAGLVDKRAAIAAACACLVAGVGLAAGISLPFLAVVVVYLAVTSAYTYSLKRKMIVDVIVLSMLYSIRVIGGAVAIGVSVSEWLLAFSMFIFAALALVKRYTELVSHLDRATPGPSNRNYEVGDLPIVAALAAASGFNAVTVFALYVSSDVVRHMYARPQILWLVCPVLMYWMARIIMLAHRRMMHDDPVVFAMRDWRSCVCGAAIGAILLAAAL